MKIMKTFLNTGSVLALLAMSFSLHAAVIGQGLNLPGISGPDFSLHAQKTQVVTPDGDSIQLWGFAPDAPGGGAGIVQYPAPTLIVTEGQLVSVTISNVDIPQDVSLAFPGQSGVTVTGTAPVTAGGASVKYEFTAGKPGTYMYHSAESPQIQIDMGLVGALIVRPASSPADCNQVDELTGGRVDGSLQCHAYNAETPYDREYLFLLSEMDPKLHYLAEDDAAALPQWDNAGYVSQLFFINGRNAPDTLAPDNVLELPHQPYGSLVRMHPGERVLVRVLNVGRNQHPLHLHGNHFDQIARDGRLLGPVNATTGVVDMRPVKDYTLNAIPGSTADLIWDWTGEGLGWDIYGHGPGDAPVAGEDMSVHAKVFANGTPLPVVIPENQDLAFGGFYSGSPFLGNEGGLPIGEGGLNPEGGIVFMWHSHSERELTNNDIFPGGMLTMVIVESRD